MGILKARIENPQNHTRTTKGNIFLDSGSDQSYITEDCAQRLGLPVIGRKLVTVSSFGHQDTKTYPITHIRLIGPTATALVEAFITKSIQTPITTKDWSTTAKNIFPEYDFPQLEENPFNIEILIGMDHLNSIRTNEIETRQGFKVQNSILGIYVEGAIKKQHNEGTVRTFSALTNATPVEDYEGLVDFEFDHDKAEADLVKFLEEDEDFTAAQDREPSQDELLKKFKDGVHLINTPEGPKYEVPFLWKEGDESKKELTSKGSNFGMALAFLHQTRDRLIKKGKLEAANNVIETAIKNGYYEEVETNPSVGHHICTFFVPQPHSTTTPLRHVLAANLGRPSINSQLEKGPSLINDLPTVLRRFRGGRTGISADISKAYHALIVREEDRDFMRILFIRDNKLITLRLARVPFGTTLAPFQLFATLIKHLTTHSHQQAEGMVPELYSDNLLCAKNSNELEYALNAVTILGDGGFDLKKFSTNSALLMKELEQRNLLNIAEREFTRTLGMKWNLKDDTLSFCPIPDQQPADIITLRSMKKRLPRHYDPLGIMQCTTMPGTKFQSDMLEKGYKMDEALSEEDAEKWRALYAEVQKSMELTIPRYHEFDLEKPVRLQVFSDASMTWGGSVGYLSQNGKAVVVAGKAKMPAKRLREAKISVPRRELEAAVIGSKLMATLINTYESTYKIEPHLWSDSTTVLSWLSKPEPMERFVQNRVTLIKDLVPGVPWHYIETNSNPSDCVSRGLEAKDYLDPTHLYWKGPKQMHQEVIQPFRPDPEVLNVLTLTTSTQPVSSILNLVFSDPQGGVFRPWAESCQTLSEVKRHLVSAIKLSKKWRNQELPNAQELSKHVTEELIKAEQMLTMPTIVEYLERKAGHRPREVQPLSLFLKDGIVRVGGRLGLANLPFANRYPIYLAADSPLLHLRVMEFHHRSLHQGSVVTRARMQKQYWIPRSSRIIKRIIRNCYRCKRANGPPFRWPQAPDLPCHRVDPATPYQTIGVDLTGHFFVRTPHGQEKVYICLFIDAATRHINLELMENMETTSFLATLRKHAATYSTPRRIISDRATYFIKSKAVLGEQLGQQFLNEVGQALERQGVVWQLNPASASHMGGFFERGVGLVKQILKRVIGKNLLEKLEFETLIKEAACSVNSRILAADNPTDHRDRLPITPSHLVHGREIAPLPYGEVNLNEEEDPSYDPTADEVLTQWRRMAARIIAFKEQFTEEYLQDLRRRHHNEHHSDPVDTPKIGVGDLVIVGHSDNKRALWDMGVVEEILPSNDSRVRAVKVKTKNGMITRPIIKLYPLRTAEELRPNEHLENQSEEDPPTQPVVDEGPENPEDPESQDDQTIQPEVAEADTDRQPAASTQPDDAAARRPTRAAKAAAEEKIYIDSLHLD